ncbi:hypothetical protein [Streptomyces triculaminicus]|uniref:hypothetical protein n=1 Tax=Streptomyces triculaminicus TaxID=2816232 RepID=UPI0037D6752F
MLVDSHSKRAAARRAGRIGLLDRGLPMLMAAAAATCYLKDQLGIDAALDTVTCLASEVFPQAPEEASVLLLPSWDTSRSYAITSARDQDDWTGIYSDYQHALHRVLLAQAERDCYSTVIDCENRSVHEVHAQVLTHTVLP